MKKYAQNLTEKIISEHLVRGRMKVGTEIFLRVDSTLVHDMSGTLAYIGFEAMGIDKIQVPAAVTFQDHNLVAMDHRSLDDHRFVASAARRYGSMLSKAGNGICHSVYYSRIGCPGTVLAGADSPWSLRCPRLSAWRSKESLSPAYPPRMRLSGCSNSSR